MRQYYNQRHKLACDIDSELPPEPLFEDVRPLTQAGHLPRKRHLWFMDLWQKRGASVTRQLHRVTTQRLTRVLLAAKDTLKDWNRTRKIEAGP